MKKTLFVHIGRPKVGSSALQHFCLRNSAALARSGFCYLKAGRFEQASHLLAYAFLPELANSTQHRNADAAVLKGELANEITRERGPNYILSSENFWFVEPENIRTLVGEAIDVKIVAYVRRQDSVLLSSFVQEVKQGLISINLPMEEYIADTERLAQLEYDCILDRWSEIFGIENVIVRVYEDCADQIEMDFLTAIGATVDEELTIVPRRLNSSLAYDLLEFASEVNLFPAGERAKEMVIGPLSEITEHMDDSPIYDAAPMLNYDLRCRILEHFRDSNRRLVARYINVSISDESPFPALSHPGELDKVTLELDEGTARMRRMLAGLFVYQQQRVINLQNRVSRLELRLRELVGDPSSCKGRKLSRLRVKSWYRWLNRRSSRRRPES